MLQIAQTPQLPQTQENHAYLSHVGHNQRNKPTQQVRQTLSCAGISAADSSALNGLEQTISFNNKL